MPGGIGEILRNHVKEKLRRGEVVVSMTVRLVRSIMTSLWAPDLDRRTRALLTKYDRYSPRRRHSRMRQQYPLSAIFGLMHHGKKSPLDHLISCVRSPASTCPRKPNTPSNLATIANVAIRLHRRLHGFYGRAMAIFEVMLALTFPSLRKWSKVCTDGGI